MQYRCIRFFPPAVVVPVYGPTDTTAVLGTTRVRTPVLAGIRTISIWLKIDPATLPAQGTQGAGRFLYDLRQIGSDAPLWLMWTDDLAYTYSVQDVFVSGARVAQGSYGLSALATNQLVRVDIVLPEPQSLAATLFGRYKPDNGNTYSLGARIGTITFLSTAVTAAQAAANPMATAPAGAVLAQYTWRGITGGTMPDASGHGAAATLLDYNAIITGPTT